MEDYNKDELNAPSWMNEAFFQDVLRKSESNNTLLITDLVMSPATIKGDHFASVMFRATIGYDTSQSKGKTKSLIIKTMPDVEGVKQEMLGDSFVFETEIAMYSETIPKLEAELRKVGDKTVLGAKAVYYSLKPRKCIIFEDIVPLGYETIRNGLPNLTEVKAALTKLGKWHAVSYKLAAEGDKSVTSFKEGFLNMKDVGEMPFIKSGIDNLIDLVQQIDELKIYLPNLQTIRGDVIKRSIDSFNAYREKASKGIFVLNHGDFHAKNMMFKISDENEFQDVMLLDFQMCCFGPAVIDLIYAKYMLFSVDIRTNHGDELIHFYYTQFRETLEKLKFQGEYPKLADYMIEFIKHRHFEIFLIATMLPFIYAMASGSKFEGEAEEFMQSNDMRMNMYHNPDYIKELKQLLPRLLHRGYLE